MTDVPQQPADTPAPAPEPTRVSRRTVRGIAADSLGAGTRLIALGSIIVSVMVTLCFIAVSLMVLRVVQAPVDETNANIINQMWAGLLVLQTTVVNYWCGSSSGSARKDHIQSIETTASVNTAAQGRT